MIEKDPCNRGRNNGLMMRSGRDGRGKKKGDIMNDTKLLRISKFLLGLRVSS